MCAFKSHDLPNQVLCCTHFLLLGKSKQQARHPECLSGWYWATHYLWVQDKNLWRRESKPQSSLESGQTLINIFPPFFFFFLPPISHPWFSFLLSIFWFSVHGQVHELLKNQDTWESWEFTSMDCTAYDLCLEGFERNMYFGSDWGMLGKEPARCGEHTH